jgi:hypothetical protein
MRIKFRLIVLTAWLGISLLASPVRSQTSTAKTAGAAPDAPATITNAWIDERVKSIQPTADERKFDQIGWVTDILTAQKLAKEHNRPIFLFSHDGRMAQGRC